MTTRWLPAKTMRVSLIAGVLGWTGIGLVLWGAAHASPVIQHPGITETAPPVYFFTVAKRDGGTAFVYCGQLVDEETYYRKVADFLRNNRQGKCPRGRY